MKPMKKITRIAALAAVIAALMLTPVTSSAREPADGIAPRDSVTTLRPVFAAYTVTAGWGQLADTYLSPLKYNGTALSLDYERRQAMKFNPRDWTMRLAARLEGVYAENHARNANMWALMLRASWGMTRRWRLPGGFSVGVGGSASLLAGCLYNRRNSNNPASAKAAVTLDLTAYGAWQTRLGRVPLTLMWQPSMPVTGVFFGPDYGELYYEIYLGNHSGLAHCAWWGNYISIDNLVTADLRLGATSLRLGLRSGVLSTRASGLTTRIVTVGAVVGVSGEWLSYDPRRPLSAIAKTISATY